VSRLRRSVVTVTVALMVGAGCIGGSGSTEAFCERLSEPLPGDPWVDVDFMVYINPEADDRDVEAIRDALDRTDEIDGYTWVDQDEAYAQFVELFADSPEMIEAVSPEILPAIAQVRAEDRDPEVVLGIGQQFENRPGVYRVVFASEAPRSVIDGSIRPLTSGSGVNSSAFTRGRAGVRLAEVAPSSIREHADVLEELWAAPDSVGHGDAGPVVTAARQVAAYYDTECT
jgi:hypothetical protein